MASGVTFRTLEFTIEAGQSLSAEVPINTFAVVAFRIPENFTLGTDGAPGMLTFEANVDGSVPVLDDAGDETLVLVPRADCIVGLSAQRTEIEAVRFASGMKIRSGTIESPIVQAETVTILLFGKDLAFV